MAVLFVTVICSALSLDTDSGLVLLDKSCPADAAIETLDVYVQYAWGESEEPARVLLRDGQMAFVTEDAL